MNQPAFLRRSAIGAAAGTAVLLALIATQRGQPGSLLPHGYCFTWNPPLLWTHVASDFLIGAAYVSIPVTLIHLVRKRTDMPFNWIVVLFALFIVSCGSTHWIEVWTVWNPDYWLAGSVKLVTAVVSMLTAAALVYLVPRILAIPTVGQLTAAKAALEVEVRQRREIEDVLRRERAELEDRVRARTRELEAATVAAEHAHADAEMANRLKDRFLAKVSHELRTPLQSTISWAQVLQQAGPDSPQARQASDRIIHNVRSQARLIDDLLDISRILSGKLRLELQEADAIEVVDRAVDVVRATARSRGVEIDVVRTAPSARVTTDPVRLEQVVWNLLNNAVQASPDGGRVRLTVAVDPATMAIDVQDWGVGIDPGDLRHVFEPFRQVPGSGSAHRGLGLGLAIADSIVRGFGGELAVRSDGPGRGSTFTMRVPVRGDAGSASGALGGPARLGDADRQRLQGLSVLYVEDEPDIAESGRLMLESLGVDVTLSTRFEDACDRIRAGGFDVLLSDLNLGDGRDALELLPLLRAEPHGRDVPAIVLSAYGSADDLQVTRAAGFAAHLVKPVDAVTVARALASVVVRR